MRRGDELGHRYAVIMAGGHGTRFWPQSRRHLPKQFLTVCGRRSLLQDSVRRLKGVVRLDHTVVVAASEFARLIRRQLPALPSGNLLIEPVPRGTAPCLALAAEWIARRDPAGLMAVLPADHVIADIPRFRRAVLVGFKTAALQECLVTFGVTPTGPETGYGYIEVGPAFRRNAPRVSWVSSFREKPDQARARAFLKAGRYLWNSGMFVWRVDVLRDAFELHAPAIARAMRSMRAALGGGATAAAMRRAYCRLQAVSIDVAVMERAQHVAVVAGDFGWADVGSWAAMAPLWGTDGAGNARRGKTVLVDCRDTIAYGAERLVAVLGVDDLVVVDSPGAVLVCTKSRAQEVRRIVSALARGPYRHLR